ncbi:MAG: diacylglycerol kinase family protein [Bacteroidota bacterium]
MKRFSFIVNPIAGNGRSAGIVRFIEAELQRREIPFEVLVTTRAGEAVDLARSANADTVVAVGGDGTVNEVVNGLPHGKTLGIIPTGSGNDLIKSLAIPKRPKDAFFSLLKQKTTEIDLGTVRCSGSETSGVGSEPTKRMFTNGVGVGFDASVAIRKGEIPFLRGTPVYIVAVLQTLLRYRAPVFSFSTNGVPPRDKKLLLAAIGNGRCAGGGFYLTPNADPGDGAFDVTLVDDVSVWKILRLMPLVMRGKHMGNSAVSSLRTTHMTLQSTTPFNVHADGEIVGRSVRNVEIQLTSEKLPVVCG